MLGVHEGDGVSESALMDPAIAKALKEREELQKRLAEIEQFLRLYKEFSEGTDEVEKEKTPVDCGNESTQINKKSFILRAKLVSRLKLRGPSQVVKASRGILQDAGEPMTRGELAAELERRVYLPGPDKESRARYVGTI